MFVTWINRVSGISWCVRNISEEGRFFGDMTDRVQMQQRNFAGEMNVGKSLQLRSCIATLIGINSVQPVEANILYAGIIFDPRNALQKPYFQQFWESPADILPDFKFLRDELKVLIADNLVLGPNEKKNDWHDRIMSD